MKQTILKFGKLIRVIFPVVILFLGISNIANSQVTKFITPTSSTTMIVGSPLTVTWNVQKDITDDMFLTLGTENAIFPPTEVKYSAGRAVIDTSICPIVPVNGETQTTELKCKTLRTRISSGLKFYITGRYNLPNENQITIKSSPFSASYPKNSNAPCLRDGVYVESGSSRIFYSVEKPENGVTCKDVSKTHNCSNGVLTPNDTTYKYAWCGSAPKQPVANPPSGTFNTSITASLSSVDSSTIRYSSNGTTPTCSTGKLYSVPITISTSTTIKAIGCSPLGGSPVATINYTITKGCSLAGTIIPDGASVTLYNTTKVPFGDYCTLHAQRRTCNGKELSGDFSYANSSCNESIYDLNGVLAPSSNEKNIYIALETNFPPNSVCVMGIGGPQKGKITVLQSSSTSTRKSVFNAAPLVVSNWRNNPTLCSTSTIITQTPGGYSASVLGKTTGQPAMTLAYNNGTISMRGRAIEQMVAKFGGAFFPSKESAPSAGESQYYKLNYSLTPKFQRVAFRDFTSLPFTFTATLKSLYTNTGCVSGTPPNSNASLCYNPNSNASQYRITFGNVVWRDPRCTANVPDDPICKYEDNWMYVTASLYDERREFHTTPFFKDPPTQHWIYRVDLHDFLPIGTTQNPFQIIGKKATAQADLRTEFKKILKEAEAFRDPATGQRIVPPRLKKSDGTLENDDEYLDHYGFSTNSIGYEVTTLSDLTYDIHEMTLRGVRGNKLQSPACKAAFSPSTITKGQSTTFSWSSALATEAKLNGKKSVPLNGSQVATPTETIGYSLEVSGLGGTTNCYSIVTVQKEASTAGPNFNNVESLFDRYIYRR